MATRAAADVLAFSQDTCACARFQFVVGSDAGIDAFCRALQQEMGMETRYGDGPNGPVPHREAVDELYMLDMLAPLYQVYGKADGSGIVVRSTEPVGFSPSGKIINVVQVENLTDALPHVTVATQT